MTTPESDPYAESGGSEWEVRPAVPGWNVGQDFLTGPIFDDTGWHIDLSNVDWAGNTADRGQADPQGGVDGYGPPVASWRADRRDRRSGNGAASYPAGPGPQDERTAAWPKRPRRADRPDQHDLPGRPDGLDRPDRQDLPDRPAGRHARHARAALDGAPVTRPGRRPAPGGGRRDGMRSPGPTVQTSTTCPAAQTA